MRFRRTPASLWLFIVLLLGTYPTGSAHANGRFPQAQAVVTVAPEGNAAELTMYLRATFGLLVSRDSGKSFRFVCEQRFGYTGSWDPPIEALRDGRLFVGRADGLASTMDGCHVDEESALAGETVKDLTTNAARTAVFAITSTPGKASFVWRRAEDGEWQKLGKGLPDTNWLTIDVAPSRPSRVYVSGQPNDTVRGRIYVSDDGGATFVVREHPMKASGPYFLAAIDPKDPDRLLLRHLHFGGSDLYLSTDAGKTLKLVLHMDSAMYGFAKSKDGDRYWVGSGLPEDGVLTSKDRGEHFEKSSNTGVLCLHASERGLFACGNPAAAGGIALLRSDDHGATFAARLAFPDIVGPVVCADDAGTREAAASLCDVPWRETRPQLLPPFAKTVTSTSTPIRNRNAGDSGVVVARDDSPVRRGCACTVQPEQGGRGALMGSFTLVLGAALRWMRRDPRRARGPRCDV